MVKAGANKVLTNTASEKYRVSSPLFMSRVKDSSTGFALSAVNLVAIKALLVLMGSTGFIPLSKIVAFSIAMNELNLPVNILEFTLR